MLRLIPAITAATVLATLSWAPAAPAQASVTEFLTSKPDQSPGALVVSGFQQTDTLLVSVSLTTPPTGTTFEFETTTGLTKAVGYTFADTMTAVNFTGTQDDVNAALASMLVTTGAATGTFDIKVSASISQANVYYNPANNHYYEYVQSSKISWTDALAAAAQKKLFGASGYLVTITDASENSFTSSKVSASDIWIGASDADKEGTWKWMSGPESGTVFWTGTGQSGSVQLPHNYASWDVATGEPNDYTYGGDSCCQDGEDYAVTNWAGSKGLWNDVPNAAKAAENVQGYLVEYSPPSGGFTGGFSLTKSAKVAATQSVTITAESPADLPAGSAIPTISYSSNPVMTNSDWTTQPTCAVYAASDTGFTTPLSGSQPSGTYVTQCSGGSATKYVPTYVPGSLTILAAGGGGGSGGAVPTAPPVPPLLPVTLPGLALSGSTLTCDVGSFSDTPSQLDVALIVDGVRQETRRGVMPASAVSWDVAAVWRGSSVTCEVVAREGSRVATAFAPVVTIPVATTPSSGATADLGPTLPGSNPNLPISGVPLAQSVFLVNGQPATVSVKPDAPSVARATGLEIEGSGFTMRLIGQTANNKPLGLTADGALILEQDRTAYTEGTGFKPNSDVNLYVFSTARFLGTVKTDANGLFRGSVPLPLDIPAGRHTLQANGLAPEGAVRSLSLGVQVQDKSTPTAALRTAKATVFFTAYSAALTTSAKKALRALAQGRARATTKIVSIGYVQPNNTTANDKSLSTQRAKAVAAYLRTLGVKGTITTRGDGIANQTGPAGRKAIVTLTFRK